MKPSRRSISRYWMLHVVEWHKRKLLRKVTAKFILVTVLIIMCLLSLLIYSQLHMIGTTPKASSSFMKLSTVLPSPRVSNCGGVATGTWMEARPQQTTGTSLITNSIHGVIGLLNVPNFMKDDTHGKLFKTYRSCAWKRDRYCYCLPSWQRTCDMRSRCYA